MFHQHGIAVGDLSPKNLLFSYDPAPRVYFIDCDAMRFQGRSVMPQLETPGWEVRIVNTHEELGSAASDSYKLGLLALRLLTGTQDTRDSARLPRTVPTSIRQLITAALAPDPGRRPGPADWVTPLGTAAATASTRPTAAPPSMLRHLRPATAAPQAASAVTPYAYGLPTGTGPRPRSPVPHRATARRTRSRGRTIMLTCGVMIALVAVITVATSSLRNSPAHGNAAGAASAGQGAASPAAQQPSQRAAALPAHYASSITAFAPAAKHTGTWTENNYDGSSSQDSVSVGATHLANGELTFSFVARHSGADSALTLGTGGACVTVSAGSVTFDEMPMAAMPSIDATYPDDFSGSITVAAFMPGTYTLKWGCNNAALYDVEAISLGTLQGTSLGQPHIDQNYGSWVWFVTEVDYTAAKTTVRLTTISENGMFKLGDNTWYLASERQIGNGGVTATAKSVVSRIIGQENQTFGSAGQIVQLTVTFHTGTRGLYFYYDDSYGPQDEGETDHLP